MHFDVLMHDELADLVSDHKSFPRHGLDQGTDHDDAGFVASFLQI
jgi:hypothetical protein